MKLLGSPADATGGNSWYGERRHEASLDRLLRDMNEADVSGACRVTIADGVDNEVIIENTTCRNLARLFAGCGAPV